MSNQLSMKQSTKPLKGLTVSSNYGSFETISANNLVLESISIAGVFEDGIFDNVIIKNSEIINTVIGAESPNVGYFTDLRSSQNVNFISNEFGSYVNWDPTTSVFNINNSTLRVNNCSFLGNLEICENYIKATNPDGNIGLYPKDSGSIFMYGPIYISTSLGNYYSELTQGGITNIVKNDIIFKSSQGSSIISTFDKQTLVTTNGDIELRTESPSNITINSIYTTNGSTRLTTYGYHNVKSGDVITVSSAGSLNGNYTIGSLISDQSFILLPNFTTSSTITSGAFTKLANTNILLNTESLIKIPTNTELTFGVTSNAISGNTSNLLISSFGDTAFSVPTSNSILIPQSTPINFSSIYNTNGNYSTNGNYINYDGTSINLVGSNMVKINSSVTQIDSTNTRFYDPILSIADYTLNATDSKDRGIEFRYYDVSSGSMKLGWFGYKVESNKFTLIPDAVNINETIYGAAGTFEIGNISATNITMVTGGSFNMNCGYITNVNTITGCSGTINLNATSNLNITSGNRISLIANNDIYIPNNIPIRLGTSNIIEETSGNISINAYKNIRLLNQSNGSVSIPVNSFISFDGSSIGSQRISSNTSGDLIVTTNKNLYLTTTSGNVILSSNNNVGSTQSNLQFGNSSEIIYGNTAGIVLLSNSQYGTFNGIASSNVNLSSSIGNINVRSYNGDVNLFSTFGNIRLLPTTRLVFDISGTGNSIRYDSSNLVINGSVTNAVDIKNASVINLGATSNINITTGTFVNFSSDRTRYIVSDTSNNLWIVNGSGSGGINISSASTIINNQGGLLNAINSFTNISSNTLTVTGTNIVLNAPNVKIQDPILSLANYSVFDNKDRGIDYNYLLTSNGSLKTGWFGWKNTTNRFTFYSDAVNTDEIVTGTLGNVEFDSIYLKNGITFTNSGQIDMSCGTISNLRTIIGCSGTVNIIGTDNVNISGNNLMLSAGNRVQIPYNIPLSFGSTSNSILSDTNGNMTITALGGSGTLVLNSNVQINGTTQNVYSTVTNIQDPIFSLGGVSGPVLNDFKDRGIEFKWNNNMGPRTGFFGYKNNIGRFVFIQSGTNVDEIYSGSYGDVQFGNGYFTNLDLANGTISNVNTISGGGINIISTASAISLSSGNVILPYDTKLNFGSTNNAISANTSGTLEIKSVEDISFITPTSGNASININTNTPLNFGPNSSITYNTSNNLQISNSNGNINLTPKTSTGNIIIPVNTFLGFGSTENSLISNGQELLLNGYKGISINTTNFTISGNVNIIGTISAAVNKDFDINTYILPLGTSQLLDISSVVNYSTVGNLKVTVTSVHNFKVGDQVILKNTNSIPSSDGTYNITGITDTREFIIVKDAAITTDGTAGGTVKSNLTTYQGKDVGIQVNYWTTTGNTSLTSGTLGYKTGFFGFKNSTERWTYYKNATISNSVVTGDLSDIEVNKVFANRLSGFVLDGNVTTGSNAVIGSNFQIAGGTINSTPIGVNTAQSGRFTNLSNTVSASFSNVTFNSSLAYTFERYTLSSGGLQTRNPSTNYVISLFSVTGPNYTSSSGTMPSSSANIVDGTFKILVCSSMGTGSSHTVFFGANKLITPNPLNASAQATRIVFKRQGQSAQLVFDAQGNNSQGSWILLSNGVYVS